MNFIILVLTHLLNKTSILIRHQVHISEKLSALRLTRHGFILFKKGVLIGLKCMSIVYKLSFVSIIKRCEIILVYPEHKYSSGG
jgi:hypothetical protein